ncbi:MAG: hypothetical protein HY819_23150 [Acidobacteria bacterium]|nr:hypothetical protein [Acidobacteriota bacterium]
MLLKGQHQKFVAPQTIAKRGWSGAIGWSLGSCTNPNSLLIGMSFSPSLSPNDVATRYLDFGQTERHL